MEELDLKEIFNIFWKRKVGIIIILLVAIALGVGYSFLKVQPIYTSYTSLLLIPEDSNEQNTEEQEIKIITKADFTLNSQLIGTYGELIKKKDILQEVIDELKLEDVSVQELKKDVIVTAITDTGVMKITVTNTNPDYAAKIADKLAEIFDKKIADTYIPNNVSIVDKAEISKEPNNTNHKKDIIVSIFIGIVVACGYVLLRYMWDSSNKK